LCVLLGNCLLKDSMGPVALWRDARLLWRSSSKLTVSPAALEGGRPGPGGLSSSGVEQS